MKQNGLITIFQHNMYKVQVEESFLDQKIVTVIKILKCCNCMTENSISENYC